MKFSMNCVKKWIAFLLIAVMTLPMISDLGILVDCNSIKVYAADTESSDNTEDSGNTKKKSNYKFAMLPDTEIYDYDNQIYKADLKSDKNNVNVTIDKLGKKDYPYVIMELVPDVTGSRLRIHLADQGYYDLSADEVAEIELTESEKRTIRVNALEYFFYENEEILIANALKKPGNSAVKKKKEQLDEEKEKLSELNLQLAPFRNQYDMLKEYLDQLNNGYGTVNSFIGEINIDEFKFSEKPDEDISIKNNLKQNFDGLKTKYSEYEALAKELDELNEERLVLQNQLNSVNVELAQKQDDKATLNNQKKDAENEKKALENRYNNGYTNAGVGSDIDKTQTALKNLENEISNLEKDNEDCKKIAEDYLTKWLNENDNSIDKVREFLNKNELNYELMSWEFASWSQREQLIPYILQTNTVKKEIAEKVYVDINSPLAAETETLRSQRTELEAQLALYEKEKEDLPGQIKSLEDQIKELEVKIAEKEEEINKFTSKEVQELNDQLSEKQSEINKKKDEITKKMQAMYQDLQGIVNAAQTPMNAKKTEIEQQKRIVSTLEKEIRSELNIFSVATELNKARSEGENEELKDKNLDKKIGELEQALLGLAEYPGLEKKAYVTSETYNNYIMNKEEYALQYKINARKTERYTMVENGMSVKFPFKYTTQYAVENGEFVINKVGAPEGYFSGAEIADNKVVCYNQKTISSPEGSKSTNVIYGEYALTQTMYNPLAIGKNALWGFNDGIKFLEPKYIFEKSCFSLGYQTTTENNQAGAKIVSQQPYVDEYIFAGWSVPITTDGKTELVPIENTETEEFKKAHPDFSFSDVTDLYTIWSVRYYEEDKYNKIETEFGINNNNNVSVQIGKYIVHLPEIIASNHSEGIHDPKNQLSFCTPVTTKVLTIGDGSNYQEEEVSYVNETSAWYFSFDEELSVKKLQQIAPKLMADTDYYVRTYDQEVDPETGNVTYYPYNVVTVTITPEELNKMVYYEYEQKGLDPESAPYMESSYLNKFLDNVDLFVLMKGGRALYFEGENSNKITVHDLENMDGSVTQTISLAPNQYMIPTLFHKESGEIVYDYYNKNTKQNDRPDSSHFSKQFLGNDCPDLEWQIVDKMYRRIMDTSQVRRAALITDESATDLIHALMPAANAVPRHEDTDNTGAGTQNNLSKFVHMIYGFTDPTLFYDFYMNQSYTEYSFDKVKGTRRVEEYKDTYYTGLLYDSSFWNTALFFPYELLGEDHDSIIRDFGKIWNRYLSIQLFASIGLVTYGQYKSVTNEFAYTFNGDTNLDQNFYNHNIDEIVSATNENPNTKRAFDYFRGVGGRATEIKNGKIATKSAIEYMIQSVRNGVLSSKERYIEILNAMPKGKKFDTPKGKIEVATVPMDDLGATMSTIEYRFNGASTVTGYFVVQYLWTNEYSDVDGDCRVGKLLYTAHTKYSNDDPAKWFLVPEAYGRGVLTGDKEGAFITKKIEYSQGSAEGNLPIETIRNYVENNAGGNSKAILKYNGENDYAFDALLQPKLRKESDKPMYIIAVLQFADAESYRQYQSNKTAYEGNLLSVTLKNVTLDKMSYTFYLD